MPTDQAINALRAERERLDRERKSYLIKIDRLRKQVADLEQYLWAVEADLKDVNDALARLSK